LGPQQPTQQQQQKMSNPYAKLDERHDPSKDNAEVQNVKAQILEKEKQIQKSTI